MTQDFVLDSSAAISWCLEDENTNSNPALELLIAGGLAHVPMLWLYEITNALTVAQKSGRSQAWDTNRYLNTLLSMNIEYDQPDSNALLNLAMISRQYNLSCYDAAYLELALRRQMPLATNDKKLKQAALKSKIKLI